MDGRTLASQQCSSSSPYCPHHIYITPWPERSCSMELLFSCEECWLNLRYPLHPRCDGHPPWATVGTLPTHEETLSGNHEGAAQTLQRRFSFTLRHFFKFKLAACLICLSSIGYFFQFVPVQFGRAKLILFLSRLWRPSHNLLETIYILQ